MFRSGSHLRKFSDVFARWRYYEYLSTFKNGRRATKLMSKEYCVYSRVVVEWVFKVENLFALLNIRNFKNLYLKRRAHAQSGNHYFPSNGI